MRPILILLAALLLAGCSSAPPSTPAAAATQPSSVTATAAASSPQPTSSPTPACLAGSGSWLETEYPGAAVGGTVPVRIYLPSCYEENGARYPVSYFFHGKPYTEAQWIDLGLAGLVQARTAEGSMPPMILVLARVPEPLFSGSDGGPGSYETEFFEGLVRWVDETFPTETGASSRGVVGISRGGVWALELALRNPDRVGVVAALSPALAVNHARPPYDPVRLAPTVAALPPHILLGAGDADWARPATEGLSQRLADRGSKPELRIVAGAHADATWSALLPAVLTFLSAALR